MATPKKHGTSSKTGRRRSHLKLEKQQLHPCPECKHPVRSHRACGNCGFYKNKKV